MKRAVFLLVSIFLVLTISTTAWSLPYTGADITLNGIDFSSISNYEIGSEPESGGNEWYREGTSVWTAWANQWVEYTAELTAGTWNIGLNAINRGNLEDGWYSEFRVLNVLTDDTLTVTASENEVNSDYFTIKVYERADYTVQYKWLNDKYAPDAGLDANIEITSVFFDDMATAPVPEPATMMLFGLGLLGLAGVSRRKK